MNCRYAMKKYYLAAVFGKVTVITITTIVSLAMPFGIGL
jgi:hypothetical protein